VFSWLLLKFYAKQQQQSSYTLRRAAGLQLLLTRVKEYTDN
jgi:hypothetical protein